MFRQVKPTCSFWLFAEDAQGTFDHLVHDFTFENNYQFEIMVSYFATQRVLKVSCWGCNRAAAAQQQQQ